jgi:hypothetical protein
MERGRKFRIGMQVRIVLQHWLRGGEIGEILGFEQRGQNNWLVKFERPFPGGGIEGDKLWLSEREFGEVVENEIGPETESARERANESMPRGFDGSSPHRNEARDSRQNGYV